jgi:hypothetical protein
VNLSVVDAQDLYMSAKAFTALTISELEAEWHKPALEKLAKMLTLMAKEQGTPLPEEVEEPEMEESYGAY